LRARGTGAIQTELAALARELAPSETLLRELAALREENHRLRHMY